MLNDRVENDVENGIQGLNRVVGDPRHFHLVGLGDDVVQRLVEAQIENGEEDQHATGSETPADLLDELRRPRNGPITTGFLMGWIGGA